MKNEMALKYLKALSGAVAKKNTKSLLKPKVEEVVIPSDSDEIPSDELAELLASIKDEEEPSQENQLP